MWIGSAEWQNINSNAVLRVSWLWILCAVNVFSALHVRAHECVRVQHLALESHELNHVTQNCQVSGFLAHATSGSWLLQGTALHMWCWQWKDLVFVPLWVGGWQSQAKEVSCRALLPGCLCVLTGLRRGKRVVTKHSCCSLLHACPFSPHHVGINLFRLIIV